jgi:hypothetical protein
MRRPAIIGVVIWALATIALRVVGQHLFRGPAVVLLLISLPLMVFVAVRVLADYRTVEQRAVAAIALVAPGMLLDTISAIWFDRVFPNIRTDLAGTFGGWLLFCNVVVLLTAVMYVPRRRPLSGGSVLP